MRVIKQGVHSRKYLSERWFAMLINWLIVWGLTSQGNCGYERRCRAGLRIILSTWRIVSVRRGLDTRRKRLKVSQKPAHVSSVYVLNMDSVLGREKNPQPWAKQANVLPTELSRPKNSWCNKTSWRICECSVRLRKKKGPPDEQLLVHSVPQSN